jgi:CheY-like chemotaxis protein
MAEEKASLESQLTDALAQAGEAGIRLEKLTETEKALREEHLKLGVRHAELTEQSSKLATDWATRRQALSAEIHAQNQEMEQARAEIARARDRERQLLAQVEEARAQQPAALGAEQAHTLNSLLNTIIGFSTVLADDASNVVTAEERREYLKHINESAERLSDVLRRLSARTAGPAAARPELAPPGKGWRAPGILVADPDPQVRERIEPFLSRAGYEVVYVKNASELMQKAPSLQPLAILLDAQLPPDGASRLVRELRRDPRTREIPLVLTSAGEAKQAGGNIGDVEFLSKPIDRQQLVQLMVKFDLMADGKRARKMPSSVLVVDDDRQTVSLVKAILKPFSIKVLTAENGKAAIEQALRNKPDLVLLDLVMPGVDGFEVVAALRREKETSQLPILVHTAKLLSKEERARLEGKVQCIIEKADLRQERLLELILKRGERRNRQAERPAA